MLGWEVRSPTGARLHLWNCTRWLAGSRRGTLGAPGAGPISPASKGWREGAGRPRGKGLLCASQHPGSSFPARRRASFLLPQARDEAAEGPNLSVYTSPSPGHSRPEYAGSARPGRGGTGAEPGACRGGRVRGVQVAKMTARPVCPAPAEIGRRRPRGKSEAPGGELVPVRAQFSATSAGPFLLAPPLAMRRRLDYAWGRFRGGAGKGPRRAEKVKAGWRFSRGPPVPRSWKTKNQNHCERRRPAPFPGSPFFERPLPAPCCPTRTPERQGPGGIGSRRGRPSACPIPLAPARVSLTELRFCFGPHTSILSPLPKFQPLQPGSIRKPAGTLPLVGLLANSAPPDPRNINKDEEQKQFRGPLGRICPTGAANHPVLPGKRPPAVHSCVVGALTSQFPSVPTLCSPLFLFQSTPCWPFSLPTSIPTPSS